MANAQGQWISIPPHQVFFSTCKGCGCEMYFTRRSGVNYKIHNPWHYRSKWCWGCKPANCVGPGGGTSKLEHWKQLAAEAEAKQATCQAARQTRDLALADGTD